MRDYNLAVGASEAYPRFATVMDTYGYDWEGFEVTTADGYILTTFHILGKIGQEISASSSQGSVLCQHGVTQDGASWIGDPSS